MHSMVDGMILRLVNLSKSFHLLSANECIHLCFIIQEEEDEQRRRDLKGRL